MPYSQFTNISKVKEAFRLKTQEGGRFLPVIEGIEVSATLRAYLEERTRFYLICCNCLIFSINRLT
ncbi:hypothetical protein FACHB389_18915 [Nostoc calcicola FACHB-389]|nr:hypothetical protein FACHB389_18915 [Nostoc calcicola FACHB-389]